MEVLQRYKIIFRFRQQKLELFAVLYIFAHIAANKPLLDVLARESIQRRLLHPLAASSSEHKDTSRRS